MSNVQPSKGDFAMFYMLEMQECNYIFLDNKECIQPFLDEWIKTQKEFHPIKAIAVVWDELGHGKVMADFEAFEDTQRFTFEGTEPIGWVTPFNIASSITEIVSIWPDEGE